MRSWHQETHPEHLCSCLQRCASIEQTMVVMCTAWGARMAPVMSHRAEPPRSLLHQAPRPWHRTWHSGRVLPAPRSQRAALQVARANIFTDAWGVNNAEELQTLTQALAANLFAFSIIPYAGFLYYLTKSKAAPGLMLFGWYFLLAFVGVSIPAGIYAKVHYGTTLANVDWLHGGAEVLLTFTNLFIVLGTRQAIRKIQAEQQQAAGTAAAADDQLQRQVVPADE